MGTKELTRVLDKAHVNYELIPHKRTQSAAAEAEALGLQPREVAKTLIVATTEGYVRAVLAASERIDLHKVRDALGAGNDVHLATEDDLLRDYPEFELGAVPPLGGGRTDPVLLDVSLAGRESVVFEAGEHDESIWLRTADLLDLSHAQVADICVH